MKKLILLAAFTAVFTSCSSDDSPTYYPPVAQTVVIDKETQLNGTTQMDVREFTFDGSNRLVSELTESYTITYTWNNGKITKMSAFNGTNTRETVYTYNASGQLTAEEKRVLGSNALIERFEYAYFADHYEQKYFDSSGDLWIRSEHYYDANKKNIVRQMMFSGGGSYLGKYEYTFDDKKSVDMVAPYNQLPKPFYDANNSIGTKEYTTANELMESVDFSYESNATGYTTAFLDGNYSIHYNYVVK